MHNQFIELRCKTTQGTGAFECRKELGGPSVETLKAHPFDSAPWEDVRYCPACRTMWHISIASLSGTPVLTPIENRVNFVPLVDMFRQVIIKSRSGEE